MLKLPTSEIVLRAGFQSNVSLLSTLLLVSANPHQRQDLLDRVLQDRSLQYLNQLYLDKTENATSLFEEIKSYLSATGSGFKLVIDRKPCGDNMDMASKLVSTITKRRMFTERKVFWANLLSKWTICPSPRIWVGIYITERTTKKSWRRIQLFQAFTDGQKSYMRVLLLCVWPSFRI